MTQASTASGRSILLAEPDPAQLRALAMHLQTRGYLIDEASTLDEALVRVAEYPYDLALTDLFATRLPPRLDAARHIRSHCQPTPVGILTAWPLTPTEATRDGFAFLLPKPLDVDALLRRIAALLHPTFTPEQAQQARLIRRFLEALSTEDWDVLRTLCTPDVGYYPLTGSVFTTARELLGIDAYLSYVHLVRSRLPDLRIERVVLLAQVTDVIARYRASWQGPDGERRGIMGMVICRFRGERIFQIGVTLHRRRLQALLDAPQEPPSMS